MTWALLALAILLEVTATLALKPAGAGSPAAIAIVVAGYGSSFSLLAYVVQRLEVGIVYAVWSAAGTAIVALAGIVAFGESLTALKLVGLALVICGVVVLNLAGAH